jgi:hypothetical protein
MMRRRLWIAAGLLLLLALGGIAALYFWAPRRTPAGQSPLANLDLAAFQQAFNDAAGQVRVVLLLSPT